MRKLRTEEKKEFKIEIAYIVVVGSSNTADFYLLPLADSLNFNFSFLMLPNVISNNISIPFL